LPRLSIGLTHHKPANAVKMPFEAHDEGIISNIVETVARQSG